jgi:ketosteroid isomerase-like protein
MSQEIPPLEIIRAGFGAFNRCDYESWIALDDEDIEFLDLAEAPDTGVFRGHAGIRLWLAKLQAAWGEGSGSNHWASRKATRWSSSKRSPAESGSEAASRSK